MTKLSSDLLEYIAAHPPAESTTENNGSPSTHLPSLSEMSKELGLSVALLREQLEVAKAIGLVEVRPRTGIRRLPYSFLPAVRQSLSFAIATDWSYFVAYSDLRNHIETAYWEEAASKLTAEDRSSLRNLLSHAWEKLRGHPIQIPHQEHRQLHLTIFHRLGNPFVWGLLEAYWEAYEAVGLNLYTDYNYLEQVWRYHEQMVDAICQDDYQKGYEALVKHRDLLFHRPFPTLVGDNTSAPENADDLLKSSS
jgi:DNA-binding FadR family transcriptional regulator